jgi:hypothetical protein
VDVNALFWAKNFAVEACDAMLHEFDHGDQLAAMFFHVNDVRRANWITEPATGAFVQIDINYHFRFRPLRK